LEGSLLVRRPLRIAAIAAASVLAAVPLGLSTTGTAAASTALTARIPSVPASAGALTKHAPHVFRGTDHTGTASPAAAGPGNNLVYGSGSGPGVISAQPSVYLVFWGSQWSQSDPLAAYLQSFMGGLYGSGDDWTTVSQQYCEGIASGAWTCPTSATHVGVPAGALVKGVWFDNASPAIPADTIVNPTTSRVGDQLAAEAVRAAAHFGNTTSAANTQAQYVIALPSHFFTAGFGAYYCAYHSAVSSNYGSVAYTNLPYMTDFGTTCGQNSVNSNGTYDGVSIVEGHEYMETITDMRPSTGWTDSGGAENGDKCAWISSGQGAMANLTLSTGRFAVQSTWSNAFNNGNGGCVLHSSAP
jgi:serine protease